MYYHSLLLVIIICITLKLSLSEQNDSWTVGSPPEIPSSDYGRLVGYDVNKNEIVLIGGYLSYRKQIIAYNIDKDTFITYDDLPKEVYAFSNAYTQINNLLYMFTTSYLSVLELDTKEFTENYHDTSLPGFVDPYTSLCNFNNSYLIMIGGHNRSAQVELNNVEIYSINDNIWLRNTPTLQTARSETSCSVGNNKLYVFGGYNSDHYELKTIEKLDIYDLIFHGYNNTNIAWIYNNHSLSIERSRSRSVIYNNNIYIIGGMTHYGTHVTTVDVLNTITDEVSLFIPLQYGISATSAITVDNKIYAFAGQFLDSYQWQYFAFPPPTLNPITSNPTTSAPTTAIPTTNVPTTYSPTTTAPTTFNPTTNTPTTSNPTTSNPTTTNPTTNQPTTNVPTTYNPTTYTPTTAVPTTMGQCMNNSQCNVGFVCKSYECLRDCNTFAIDEFLTQCSNKFNHFESEQHKNIKTITIQLNKNIHNLQKQIYDIMDRLDSFQPVVDNASKAYFGIPINGGQSEISSPFKDELIIFMVLMNILFVVCICFLYYKLTRVSGVVNYEKVDVDLN